MNGSGPRGSSDLNHLLIRSESISSSWIEGNRLSPKKLAIAERFQHGDRVALDVIANVRATENAIDEIADPSRAITVRDIEELQHSIEPRLEPGLRTTQNWVGGPGNSPLRADFVPPPAAEVKRLVANLAEFVSATEGNPVTRAAIAHAQFETIHPFIDGNGRTGRALVHTVLKRADALRTVLVPISTVFASDTTTYIGGLTTYRQAPADSTTGSSPSPRRSKPPPQAPSSSPRTSRHSSRRFARTSSSIAERSASHRLGRGPVPSS